MSFSMDQDDLLVNLVEKNPSLYDVTLESYKDNDVRDKIWEDIARVIGKPSANCKKRWKYIRDSYNRNLRKRKLHTGSGCRKPSKWSLYDKLHFLDKILPDRIIFTNLEIKNNEDESSEEISIADETITKEETVEFDTSDEDTSQTGKFEEAIWPLQSTTLEHWTERDNKRQEGVKKAKKQDPDLDGIKSFCNHIGTILFKLTPQLRVEAKNKIFNLMSDYEMKNIEQQRFL